MMKTFFVSSFLIVTSDVPNREIKDGSLVNSLHFMVFPWEHYLGGFASKPRGQPRSQRKRALLELVFMVEIAKLVTVGFFVIA